MSERGLAAERDQMRQWVANWRLVNEAQDELVRSASPQDPAACLARGLSLIAFAGRLRAARVGDAKPSESWDDTVRETWIRLHAARGR